MKYWVVACILDFLVHIEGSRWLFCEMNTFSLDRGFHFNVARYSLDWIKQASLPAGLTNTR
jgi:hypothetical protein